MRHYSRWDSLIQEFMFSFWHKIIRYWGRSIHLTAQDMASAGASKDGDCVAFCLTRIDRCFWYRALGQFSSIFLACVYMFVVCNRDMIGSGLHIKAAFSLIRENFVSFINRHLWVVKYVYVLLITLSPAYSFFVDHYKPSIHDMVVILTLDFNIPFVFH